MPSFDEITRRWVERVEEAREYEVVEGGEGQPGGPVDARIYEREYDRAQKLLRALLRMYEGKSLSDAFSGDVIVNENAAAGGARIHYHRTGGDKPPLVLFHGFSDNGLCWTRVAQVLEENYDLIMPDARGHGLSEAPEGEYTARVHAADLAGLIRALGLGKPALMGHSMGGSTVANTAAFYPDLVACAVLEDPSLAAPDTPRASAPPREGDARMARNRARILRFQEMTRAEVVQEVVLCEPVEPRVAVFGQARIRRARGLQQAVETVVADALLAAGPVWHVDGAGGAPVLGRFEVLGVPVAEVVRLRVEPDACDAVVRPG